MKKNAEPLAVDYQKENSVYGVGRAWRVRPQTCGTAIGQEPLKPRSRWTRAGTVLERRRPLAWPPSPPVVNRCRARVRPYLEAELSLAVGVAGDARTH